MSDKRTEPDTYDRGIVPAETAARKEREGGQYKQVPEENAGDSIDTSGGYSVDKEGLVNNFAIEPEMYVNEPGDLREKEEALKAEREQEYDEVKDTDKTGELTMEEDDRGKGTGII
ncbi:hypothetical protein [Egbenema bharatensis]|uniref:hypothetical protein n=1 Tax=Egbenema bharatensis TaxID=3463334 RepID=UPI003A8C0F24